ncbi:MAG: hypothetical protein JXR27_07265 [Paludibacteraceae bacterium]|nr:hypothetical protein [Paludibacteraceae bacterium]
MKKIFWSVLLIIPFFTGCDMLGELTKIPLPFSQSITIPATGLGASTTIETPEIETGIDSVLNDAGISSDFIEEVTLSKMEFSMSSSSDDLSFLDEVTIYISSPGKDDMKIASAKDVDNVSNLKFDVQDVDIKSFILGESFKLKIDIKTDELISEEKEIDINMEFIMDLKVLGM